MNPTNSMLAIQERLNAIQQIRKQMQAQMVPFPSFSPNPTNLQWLTMQLFLQKINNVTFPSSSTVNASTKFPNLNGFQNPILNPLTSFYPLSRMNTGINTEKTPKINTDLFKIRRVTTDSSKSFKDNCKTSEEQDDLPSCSKEFETVLYNGTETLEIGQILFMCPKLQKICYQSSNCIEANLNPLTNLTLKRIRKGDEIVLFNTNAKKNSIPPKLRQKVILDDSKTKINTSKKSKIQKTSGKNKISNLEKEQKEEKTPPKQVRQTADQQHPGYSCARCSKVFSTSEYRDKHLKYTRCVDNGDRKFPCNLCTRSFEKRDRLRIHILHVHENHRPHICRICNKAFSQSSSLNKHLRVHSGERPYHCQYCPKSFTASSILRTHIRQHSGEKPFKCVFCRKSFASHAAHDSHVRRTHGSL